METRKIYVNEQSKSGIQPQTTDLDLSGEDKNGMVRSIQVCRTNISHVLSPSQLLPGGVKVSS